MNSGFNTIPPTFGAASVSPHLFQMLPVEEMVVAEATYEQTSRLLDTRKHLPRRVFADMDGTLYRYCGRREVIRGDVIGFLLAYKQRGRGIGIFSRNRVERIKDFVARHAVIKGLFSPNALIWGAEHIIEDGQLYEMPDHGLLQFTTHFLYGDGAKPYGESIPKFIGPDEILIDDHRDVYEQIMLNLETYFGSRIPDWESTRLAHAIRSTRKGLLGVARNHHARGFTPEENARHIEILDTIERDNS